MKIFRLKPTYANLLELLTGGIVVATGIGLLSMVGQLVEPYLQWLPAVAELRHHAWYNMGPPSDGYGRHIYVGFLALLCILMLFVAATVIGQAVLWCRNLGRTRLCHQFGKEIT